MIGQQLDQVNSRIDHVQNIQTTHVQQINHSIGLTSSAHPSKVKEMERNILQLTQRLEVLK
jgi:hypothetical protein